MNYVNLSYYQFRYVRYMSDICRYVRYLSDICRYLSDIGHIGNLGSFTKTILLQKCSISLISPAIAIRSRSSRSDWLHRTDLRTDVRTHEHEKFKASYTKSRFAAMIRIGLTYFKHLGQANFCTTTPKACVAFLFSQYCLSSQNKRHMTHRFLRLVDHQTSLNRG